MISGLPTLRIEVDGRDIGSPVKLDIASSILSCNNPRQVTAEVVETITDRLPFGPVQHLDITLVDNNPLETPLCDVAGNARFEIPVGVLKGPIITTRVQIQDLARTESGDTEVLTEELPSPQWRLDRPLRSVTVPTDPTSLDKITVLVHSASQAGATRSDRFSRISLVLRGDQSRESSWRIQEVDLGRVPAGYAIERLTRLDSDSYFDLVDAGLASEPGGLPFSSLEFQEFDVVAHRVPVEASGSWYNPDNSGQGLSIQVLDDTRLIAYWYRFDSAGNPVWLFGDGQVMPPDEGNSGVLVEFDAFLSDRPTADSEPALTPWGTWQMRFTACGEAEFSWQPDLDGFEAGAENIQQLAGIGAADCASRVRSPLDLSP